MPHASRRLAHALVVLSMLASPSLRADDTPAAPAPPTPVRTKKPAVGGVPPAYVGQKLDGSEVSITPGDGKAYVISFWASWCQPCREELPVLVNIQSIAGADKIQVVAVNTEDREAFRSLDREIRRLGLTSTYDPDRKARQAYRVKGFPHMVIVGRDGRIQMIREGYSKAALDSLASALNQALAAPMGGDSDASASPVVSR